MGYFQISFFSVFIVYFCTGQNIASLVFDTFVFQSFEPACHFLEAYIFSALNYYYSRTD